MQLELVEIDARRERLAIDAAGSLKVRLAQWRSQSGDGLHTLCRDEKK
jgi:hypothetical protein